MILLDISWDAVEAIGTWVGSIGTTGALFLGFWILKGDRRREERAQASQVIVHSDLYSDSSREDDDWSLKCFIWNHSDRPIFEASLDGFRDGTMTFFVSPTDGELSNQVIHPGGGEHLELNGEPHDALARLYVTFRDASGVEWGYRLSGRDLRKVRYDRKSGNDVTFPASRVKK